MENREDKDQDKGFKVQDRRRFSESGEPRPEAVEEVPSDPGTAATEKPAASAARSDPSPEVEINFATFVVSLSTQALSHLGEIPSPIDGKMAVDLPAARQLIDILGILQEKTRGNLDAAEGNLLKAVLYDLRMKYVERTRGH